MKKIITMAALLILSFTTFATEIVVDFEDINLAEDSHWLGTEDGYSYFESGTTSFPNFFTDYGSGAYAWTGFAYSNQTDMVTEGYTNQFSVYNTSGADQSQNFVMAYFMDDNPATNTITFAEVGGVYVNQLNLCNATYAALSMKNGDAVAKKFGGESGNDEDWFKLTIKGITVEGEYTEPLDFYLADYRFEDNSQDYIIEDWTAVDLTSFEDKLAGLFMTLSSSDNGDWGMNTPAYVSMDNLIYSTEPSSIETSSQLAISAELLQNYPNPFNPETSIKYQLNNSANVNISVYSATGSKVWEMGKINQTKGFHSVKFDGSKFNSGTYFYTIELNGQMIQTKKMMLIK